MVTTTTRGRALRLFALAAATAAACSSPADLAGDVEEASAADASVPMDDAAATADGSGDGSAARDADAADAAASDADAGPEARPDDGIKNGTETDVDCGGSGNPKCDVGKACLGHGDCASDGCDYTKKCVARRSCTGHFGGDTCGAGGAGGRGAAEWESCCATAPANGVALGKYQVTAGRMRAFLERTNGNVRKFVRDARMAGKIPASVIMRPEWDPYLPTGMAGCEETGTCPAEELSDRYYDAAGYPKNEPFLGIWSSAYRQLGGAAFNGQGLDLQGCRVDAPGTHTYWMDAATQTKYFGDRPAEHARDVYDTKPLNCVTYLMAQAFCLWDGGRLETFAEWLAAWGPDPMPWGAAPAPWGPGSASYFGNRYPTVLDAQIGAPPGPVPAGKSMGVANFDFSYEHPNQVQYDYVVFLNAPGRLPNRGPAGHADVVGTLFELTSDVTIDAADPRTATARWTTNGSYEGHSWSKEIVYDTNFSLTNKYGKLGLRCAY